MSNLTDIIKESFIQYSGAVLQSRALVDVRDFLKPSARQIFYCMETDKFVHTKPFQKTLKSIGSAMRLYVHGDSSCEGVIMRAGQPFAMRYPLIEVEGSCGNLMESGNWAAPRYTAARLSSISQYLFEDMEKNTIDDWRDNYDDTEKYPSVLPSKGYYNIVNGSFGIGIGASLSCPQYNIKDINHALEVLLLNPNASFEEIYCAPDFATGALLLNEAEVKEAMKNGKGAACKLRSVIDYDIKDNCFVVKEIPYGVYTNTICGELEAIINSEENPGIERFNDLTGKLVLIKIYLAKNSNMNKVLNYLYKNTSLQYYYTINFTALDKGRYPKVFTWKEMLQAHVEHEINIYRRGYEFDLNKINEKIHIIDGLLICLARIEEVIKTIKESNSTQDASKALQNNFLLDVNQAKAVLDMKLSRLAHLEVQKLENDRQQLINEKEKIEEILNNKDKFNNEIVNGWREISKKYGDEHRTKVVKEEILDACERVETENCIVVMTENGTLKRIPADSFKPQKRNGKGIKNQSDITSMIIRTNTVDNLMVFTNHGKMYRLLVDNIPVGTNSSQGQSINTLIELAPDEKAEVIYSIYKDTDAKYVLFTTKNGMIKKTALDEYIKTKRTTGISAITLRDNDSIASVSLIKDEDLIILTKNGMSIKFKSSDVSITSRVSIGVKAINLNPDDSIIACLPIRDKSDNIAIFTSNGLGKKVPLNEFTLQSRAGKGLVCYKPTNSTGTVCCASLISDTDMVLVCGDKNNICISSTDIPLLNRAAIGNQIIKGSKIISVSKV